MKNAGIIRDVSAKVDDVVLMDSLHHDEDKGLVGIYRLYYKQILFFAQKYVKNYQVAEEIVTDVFVKLWERRTAFTSLDSVRAFLYIATKNRCLNQLRGKKYHEAIDDVANYEDLLYDDTDVFTKIIRTELLHMVYSAVQKLPQKQQEVFNMTFLEDKTVEDIGKEMNMTPHAVYTNKSRALATLRRNLQIRDVLFLLVIIFTM